MKNRQWYGIIDRSGWPAGEWDSEPDKKQWTDEATGLPCLIVRNNSGTLCGYVGVSCGHPSYGKDYDDVRLADGECPDVHGGLTYADKCRPHQDNAEHGICHVVEPGDDDNIWWLGFDCAHCGDIIPACVLFRREHDIWYLPEVYRTLLYVERQCAELARQLSECQTLEMHQ